MQPEDEFRSRLREDLRGRPAPAVGTLAADAFSTGRRMRRRQRTLRAISGTAAVVAVAVGSAAMAGAFGSNSASAGSAAPGVGTKTSRSAPPPSSPRSPGRSGPTAPPSSAPGRPVTIPPGWTVPPPASVTDPEWVTSRAVIAETKKLLPAGTDSSAYSGDYAYAGGDPRQQWAVDASMTITTAKGSAQLDVTLHDGNGGNSGSGCRGVSSCGSELLPDGSRVVVQHDWDAMGTGKLGAYIMVIRKDGMSVQVTIRDQSQLTDDQLFAVASSGAWGGLKMDKSFVDQAEATIKGTFMNPPA
jgi:hypothetical protein